MSDHPHEQCATCLAAAYAANVAPIDEPMHTPGPAHPAWRGLTDIQVYDTFAALAKELTAVPDPIDFPPLLTPAEVAAMFHVNPKTVTRWAATGRLSSIRTPGNQRRYLADEIQAFLDSKTTEQS